MAQAEDVRLAWEDECEVIDVSSSSVAWTLVGGYGAKLGSDVNGRYLKWLADGADVYYSIGAPALGNVSESGTSPPDATVSGTPLSAGVFIVEVNATSDGTLANTTFDWKLAGSTIGTAVAPVDGVLTLGTTGLSVTWGAGTFNADQAWTWYSGPSPVSEGTLTGAGTADKFVNNVPEFAKLPDASIVTPRPAAIAIAVKTASGTAELRISPRTGK